MTDSEHRTPASGGLDYNEDDLDAVSTLLEACEKYPLVFEAVLEALGPRTFRRDFTPTMIPSIRRAMMQGSISPLWREELQDRNQSITDPELDVIRLLTNVSDDAKWIAGLIITSRLSYDDQKNFAWRRPDITAAIGKERVRNGIKELKVILQGGLS